MAVFLPTAGAATLPCALLASRVDERAPLTAPLILPQRWRHALPPLPRRADVGEDWIQHTVGNAAHQSPMAGSHVLRKTALRSMLCPMMQSVCLRFEQETVGLQCHAQAPQRQAAQRGGFQTP